MSVRRLVVFGSVMCGVATPHLARAAQCISLAEVDALRAPTVELLDLLRSRLATARCQSNLLLLYNVAEGTYILTRAPAAAEADSPATSCDARDAYARYLEVETDASERRRGEARLAELQPACEAIDRLDDAATPPPIARDLPAPSPEPAAGFVAPAAPLLEGTIPLTGEAPLLAEPGSMTLALVLSGTAAALVAGGAVAIGYGHGESREADEIVDNVDCSGPAEICRAQRKAYDAHVAAAYRDYWIGGGLLAAGAGVAVWAAIEWSRSGAEAATSAAPVAAPDYLGFVVRHGF